MSQLLGGQPDKEVFKDSTVKEELEYQYRICKSEYEEHTEEMSLCVREAYEQIIEEKGIGERPEGGRVIIEEVDESDAINEEQQKSTGDEQ
ncbi:hypothetical protein [Kangiella sediminilitoris]|uniref:hypothetical protein n=1 Tax=Kangiella sediminilitoris TaxID=1144748 RepID=UPI001470AD3C|nr:hypothetical protein [Kangiella sediminilitoris]